MGCLTAPFKVLGCLGLVAVLVIGWLYRDRVVRARAAAAGPHRVAAAPAGPAAARGRPGSRALASAEAKIDSLNGWHADSIVLTPSEVASLMGSGLSPAFRKELDSLQVELLDDEVRVRARLRTARLPRSSSARSPSALRPDEPVEAIGPLRVTGPGVGEWAVRSLQIRDFPVPADAVRTCSSRAARTIRRADRPLDRSRPASARCGCAPPGATVYGAPRP